MIKKSLLKKIFNLNRIIICVTILIVMTMQLVAMTIPNKLGMWLGSSWSGDARPCANGNIAYDNMHVDWYVGGQVITLTGVDCNGVSYKHKTVKYYLTLGDGDIEICYDRYKEEIVCVSSVCSDTVRIEIIEVDDAISIKLDTFMVLNASDVIFSGLDTSKRYIIDITEKYNFFEIDSLGYVIPPDKIKIPTTFVCGYLNSFDCNPPDLSFIDDIIMLYPNPSSSDVYVEIKDTNIKLEGSFEIYYLQGSDVVLVDSFDIEESISLYTITGIVGQTGTYYAIGRLFYFNYPYTVTIPFIKQ